MALLRFSCFVRFYKHNLDQRPTIISSTYRIMMMISNFIPYRRVRGIQNLSIRAQKCFSSKVPAELDDLEYIQKHYKVERRGDGGYGSREYLLLPPKTTPEDAQLDPSLPVAALLAHRNMIFGARALHGFAMKDVCTPLVEKAVQDAGENGEQPQAIASLTGLCDWVKECIESSSGSEQLEILRSNDPESFEAVQAIATGIPREGHSVVGAGTYRDAEEGWKKVAEEFVTLGLSEEAELYMLRDARLVGIEALADRNPEYLASAGGAMARLFFL
jgi:hypothetical protein